RCLSDWSSAVCSSDLSADGRQYLPVSDRIVLASRLQLGNLRPVGNDQVNVPFSKRYFLGGATSIRGWGRYEISPLSDSGLPIGRSEERRGGEGCRWLW